MRVWRGAGRPAGRPLQHDGQRRVRRDEGVEGREGGGAGGGGGGAQGGQPAGL